MRMSTALPHGQPLIELVHRSGCTARGHIAVCLASDGLKQRADTLVIGAEPVNEPRRAWFREVLGARGQFEPHHVREQVRCRFGDVALNCALEGIQGVSDPREGVEIASRPLFRVLE